MAAFVTASLPGGVHAQSLRFEYRSEKERSLGMEPGPNSTRIDQVHGKFACGLVRSVENLNLNLPAGFGEFWRWRAGVRRETNRPEQEQGKKWRQQEFL